MTLIRLKQEAPALAAKILEDWAACRCDWCRQGNPWPCLRERIAEAIRSRPEILRVVRPTDEAP